MLSNIVNIDHLLDNPMIPVCRNALNVVKDDLIIRIDELGRFVYIYHTGNIRQKNKEHCIILIIVYIFIICKFIFNNQKIHPCLGEYLLNVFFSNVLESTCFFNTVTMFF